MPNPKRLIFITGAFRFPEGDAAAARVLGIGKALRRLDYEVHFAGWEKDGRPEDKELDGKFYYQDFPYFPQNQFRTKKLNPLSRLAKYLSMGIGVVRWLQHYSKEHKLHAVISYHGGATYLLLLKFFCWRKNIKLIVDCTEWYEPNSLPGGRWGIAALDSELRMRFVNSWIGQVIAISRYLHEYYLARNCKVLRLPPTIDLCDPKWIAQTRVKSRGLRLVYAGIPGKKDVLHSILLSLDKLREEGRDVSLNLVGPTEAEVLACVDGDKTLITRLSDRLRFHGRVVQSAVPALIQQADFSILFRPQRRSSNAGFSTKLVESLAVGVPVIANATGDIEEYIRDGKEGILVADEKMDSVLFGLRRAMSLSQEQLADMRKSAEKCARQNFHYEVYSAPLQKFVEGCR